jgi:Na+/proline symporter
MALIALYTAFNTSTVISAIAAAISVGFAAMSAPFILCIWWKKLNSSGGFSGIGAGFAAFATIKVMYPEIPADFVGFWVSLIVAVVVSLLTQETDPPTALSNADGETMDLNNRFGTLPLFRRAV